MMNGRFGLKTAILTKEMSHMVRNNEARPSPVQLNSASVNCNRWYDLERPDHDGY